MPLPEAPAALGLAAAISGSRCGRRGRGRKPFEAGLSEGKNMIVFHRAGGGDDGGAGVIAAAEIPVDRRPVESLAALPCAQDRSADRLVRPRGRGEEIEHQVVRRVFDRSDFLDDNVLLPFELLRVERAVGEKVADDVARELCFVSQNGGEIAGALDSGLCVKVAANVLNRLGDLARASTASALERHMLDEMRQPVLARALVARSRSDEHADRRRLHVGGRLGYDGEPRGKARNLYAHAAARAVWRR